MKPFAPLTTLILLLSTLPFLATGASQASGDLEVEDGRGDVSPFGFTPLGMPASGATDGIDITGFRIYGEDIDGLTIELSVANLKPTPDTLRLMSGGQYRVTFNLEGTEITYAANFFAFYAGRFDPVSNTAPTGIERIPADFYVCVPSSGCFTQRLIAQVDWDNSILSGYLPKGALAGREPVYDDEIPHGIPSIGVGSRLGSVRADVFGNFGFYDTAPDSGFAGPYVLKAPVPNEKVGLSLVQFSGGYTTGSVFGGVAEFPSASVTPGAPELVQVRVSNHNAAKRIINVSAQIAEPAQSTKWSVRVVNTLTIPGGDSRIINLIVNASETVQHRDETMVRLTARSLGFPDEIGSLRVRLVASVAPTPTRNVLFAHMNDGNAGGLSFCFPSCGSGPVWLNTLEEDPLADDGAGAEMDYAIGLTGTDFYFQMFLDTQLTRDLVLDIRKPIAATLVSTCTVCPQGTLFLELQSDEGPVASGEAPYGTSATVELVPVADRIAAGSYLAIFGRLDSTTPGPFVKEMVPRIIGGKTKVELPVIRDPDAKPGQRIPLGPAFITLSAENATGEFIAPGKSKVFPVTVVNEGVEEDIVHIKFESKPEEWHVQLQPGETYRLKPGVSATFGVLVRAPENVTEGEGVEILLNATSEADPTALSQLVITATASENAFDEETEFEADEDTTLALEEAPKKSPGPGLAFLVVAAVVGVVWRRRRA